MERGGPERRRERPAREREPGRGDGHERPAAMNAVSAARLAARHVEEMTGRRAGRGHLPGTRRRRAVARRSRGGRDPSDSRHDRHPRALRDRARRGRRAGRVSAHPAATRVPRYWRSDVTEPMPERPERLLGGRPPAAGTTSRVREPGRHPRTSARQGDRHRGRHPGEPAGHRAADDQDTADRGLGGPGQGDGHRLVGARPHALLPGAAARSTGRTASSVTGSPRSRPAPPGNDGRSTGARARVTRSRAPPPRRIHVSETGIYVYAVSRDLPGQAMEAMERGGGVGGAPVRAVPGIPG